jgi:hypothetical protein
LGERRDAQTMFFLQWFFLQWFFLQNGSPANGLAAGAVNSRTAGKYQKNVGFLCF